MWMFLVLSLAILKLAVLNDNKTLTDPASRIADLAVLNWVQNFWDPQIFADFT